MALKQHRDLTGNDLHEPKAHGSSHTNGTDDVAGATTSKKGLLSASDKIKIDAILATGSGSIITSVERIYLQELTGGGITALHQHLGTGPHASYHAQGGSDEVTAGRLTYGLLANRPASPLVGYIYIATDESRMFICTVEGQWNIEVMLIVSS